MMQKKKNKENTLQNIFGTTQRNLRFYLCQPLNLAYPKLKFDINTSSDYFSINSFVKKYNININTKAGRIVEYKLKQKKGLMPMVKNIIFEDRNNDWEIWEKNSSIERSIKRLKNQLPEMEASKQLSKIIKKFYKKGNTILDFGCAAGHFYNSLKKLIKTLIILDLTLPKITLYLQKVF